MAILSKGTTYSEDDQVTHTNLNALVDSATFDDPADETTIEKNTGTGKLQVKDGGVDTSQLADDAVIASKIADNAVQSAGILAAAVTEAKLGALAVSTAKIAATAVTGAKLNADVISAQPELAVAPADTDELLLSDAGVLKKIDIDDFVKHPAFPQAYGVVDFANGAETTLTSSYNVTSVEDNEGLGTERKVTLGVTMNSSTDYVVMISIEDQGDAANDWTTPVVTIDSDSTFTIHIAENANLRIHFTVFGTRV